MTFRWEPTYYPGRLAYQAALLPFAVPNWISGICLHHTVVPTQASWRGMPTMRAMGRYYQALGWDAGPHLFLAPDGVYAGTPLAYPGVHAGPCNAHSIGLEVVGRFDNAPWDIGLRERVYALLTVLLHWMGRDEKAVLGHRECKSKKSCPGRAIDMDDVRRQLHDRLFDRRFVVTSSGAIVRAGSYPTAQVIRAASVGLDLPAHRVSGRAHKGNGNWARVKLPSSVTGYIWSGMGRFEPI